MKHLVIESIAQHEALAIVNALGELDKRHSDYFFEAKESEWENGKFDVLVTWELQDEEHLNELQKRRAFTWGFLISLRKYADKIESLKEINAELSREIEELRQAEIERKRP